MLHKQCMAFSCQPVKFQISFDIFTAWSGNVSSLIWLDLTPWFSPNCPKESGCLHFTRSPAKLSYHCKHISVPHSLLLNNVTQQKHFYSHNSTAQKFNSRYRKRQAKKTKLTKSICNNHLVDGCPQPSDFMVVFPDEWILEEQKR